MQGEAARGSPVRAIVYGVGAMGSIMTRLLLEKHVTIVGAIARSPAKVGRDLGEVAGLGRRLGVSVEDDAGRALAREEADIALVSVGSYLDAMAEHFRVCLEHGVNVITIEEESLFPWATAPVMAAELDALAREHGATITGSGAQDVFWLHLVSTLTGAAHRIDEIVGRVTWNVDDYGPEVASHVCVGEDPDVFARRVAQEGWPPFVVRNVLDALLADLGLTAERVESRVDPVVARVPTSSVALGSTVPAGRMLGLVDSVSIDTREGPRLEFGMDGRVVAEGEADSNEWIVRGEPTEMRLVNPAVPTRLITCTTVVNRIPDVINAEPGFVTPDRLPRLRYRSRPLGAYVSVGGPRTG
jgi:2,4-diaminopentanoate dehydrogenase